MPQASRRFSSNAYKNAARHHRDCTVASRLPHEPYRRRQAAAAVQHIEKRLGKHDPNRLREEALLYLVRTDLKSTGHEPAPTAPSGPSEAHRTLKMASCSVERAACLAVVLRRVSDMFYKRDESRSFSTAKTRSGGRRDSIPAACAGTGLS